MCFPRMFIHSLTHSLTRLTNDHTPVLEGEVREDVGGFLGLHTPAGSEAGVSIAMALSAGPDP